MNDTMDWRMRTTRSQVGEATTCSCVLVLVATGAVDARCCGLFMIGGTLCDSSAGICSDIIAMILWTHESFGFVNRRNPRFNANEVRYRLAIEN
jgi:hypothetical protein